MQINADQLSAQLKRGLAPVYLVAGDELLVVQECVDTIRAAAVAAGCGERELHTVEAGFDWDAFYASTRSGSLFAARRLVELRLPTGKPGEVGAKTLTQIAADAAPDVTVVVASAKLDKAARSAKWVSAIERAGIAVTVYPIDAAALPAWIVRRMRARGLTAGAGVVELLAHYFEGNVLALAQEIDKLALLGARALTLDDIEVNLGDNARFNVFALADACVAGDRAQLLRILRSLRAEGTAPVLILWALAREARELAHMAGALAAGRPEVEVLDNVWNRRRPQVAQALRRVGAAQWLEAVTQAARADRAIKGRGEGDGWHELECLALAIAGFRHAAAAG